MTESVQLCCARLGLRTAPRVSPRNAFWDDSWPKTLSAFDHVEIEHLIADLLSYCDDEMFHDDI